jgi:hypothetical protein
MEESDPKEGNSRASTGQTIMTWFSSIGYFPQVITVIITSLECLPQNNY